MQSLHHLDLSGYNKLSDISIVGGISTLRTLIVRRCYGVTGMSDLTEKIPDLQITRTVPR